MLFEIREYVATPGRIGDVVDLFQETVIPLFRKYEMDFCQMGRTTIGDQCFDEFVYTMRFASLAEMEEKWARFVADPAFGPALAAKEATGPLYRSIRRRVVDAAPFEELFG